MADDDELKANGHGVELLKGSSNVPSVIASEGVDAARAYVGPTPVPETSAVAVNGPKVKVTDPRTLEPTVRFARSPLAQAPNGATRGSIDAPLDRPAGAFQPVAVDPSLIQEWMQHRGNTVPGEGGPLSNGAEVTDGDGESSRWAETAKVEKVDRRAHSPYSDEVVSGETEGGMGKGGNVQQRDAVGGRGIWVPLIVTVSAGVVGGLLAIKLVILPAIDFGESSAPKTQPTVSVVSSGIEPVGEPVSAATVATAMATPEVEEPSGAESAHSAASGTPGAVSLPPVVVNYERPRFGTKPSGAPSRAPSSPASAAPPVSASAAPNIMF
jgi:hypothetical protein